MPHRVISLNKDYQGVHVRMTDGDWILCVYLSDQFFVSSAAALRVKDVVDVKQHKEFVSDVSLNGQTIYSRPIHDIDQMLSRMEARRLEALAKWHADKLERESQNKSKTR